MRASNALRFYGFTAAIFVVVVLVGLTFRRSLLQPEEILDHLPQFSRPQFTKPHSDGPVHSSAAAPPSGSTSHTNGHGKSPHIGSNYLDYKPNPQPPLAKEEDYDLHQVNLRKLVWWDPSQYDDEILPELDEWPGPAPDGKYGDITDLMNDTMRRASAENQRMKHLTLKSKLTSTGKFLKIDWLGDHEGYNPNIIPHPHKDGTWIAIAQKDKSRDDDTLFSQELYCEATIVKDTLKCTKSPLQLPIASTVSPHCAKDMEWFDSNVGPHDARLFHGKDRPYIMYNQQSEFNCVGMWINDARRLVDYGGEVPTNTTGRFFWPTNLQKAGGQYSWIEKNWFPFWASSGDMYLHYDFTPTRLYAKLNEDGSVGKDLSYMSHDHDQACMARLMPKLKSTGLEWFHQASNALEITMCKSTDPDCKPTDDNTYVFVIFQTKTFYNHGQYEPYIMMFKRTAPFEIYGISKTPFWYHGRGTAFGKWRLELTKPRDQSQMIFTTSISWQSGKRKYNGFLDDELMICFGIEDKHSGVMDVTVGDLIADIAFC